MSSSVDLVVVGGGIAGASLALVMARAGRSVTILEFQDEYRDLVRGEALSPWGMVDAVRMGVSDALDAACPSLIRRWTQWDEAFSPDEVPTVDIRSLAQKYVPDAEGLFAIRHHRTCEELARAAVRAGAELHFGVRRLEVRPGRGPTVRYEVDGRVVEMTPRLVIGAGGRGAPTAKQMGLVTERAAHHWAGGLAVDGVDDWPLGVMAMGTEGHRMFFVFPQGDGHARLYLNFPTELRQRYAGPTGAAQFLADFNLQCLPLSETLATAVPAGPCMSSPSYRTWLNGAPVSEGVVLIGDEAGANDPVLGTGLANALRDARSVSETLLASNHWWPADFGGYVAERTERMRRLSFAADLVCRLSAEFGPEAVDRRRRAWERMGDNEVFALAKVAAFAGPEHVPAEAFDMEVVERLLRPRSEERARLPRFRLSREPVAVSG